jgi:hypothetical protein
MSGNPFSDSYVIDFEEFELDDKCGIVAGELLLQTVSKKNIVSVPVIDQLPHDLTSRR